LEKLIQKRNLKGDAGVNGRIILKWILKAQDETAWAETNWLSIGSNGGGVLPNTVVSPRIPQKVGNSSLSQ
jgi:hypothetical protein